MSSRERERDVGIICVIIYDDLALKAWTQRREREREREGKILSRCRNTPILFNTSIGIGISL